ncbi:hypothetical protein THAOC_07363, partial [Thalassiosira oceanica]
AVADLAAAAAPFGTPRKASSAGGDAEEKRTPGQATAKGSRPGRRREEACRVAPPRAQEGRPEGRPDGPEGAAAPAKPSLVKPGASQTEGAGAGPAPGEDGRGVPLQVPARPQVGKGGQGGEAPAVRARPQEEGAGARGGRGGAPVPR